MGERGRSKIRYFSNHKWDSPSCQGSIASPDLLSMYLDPLIKDLRALGVGCHVGELCMGVMAYAYDLVLLAPNRAAAEEMLCVNHGQLRTMFSSAQTQTPAASGHFNHCTI